MTIKLKRGSWTFAGKVPTKFNNHVRKSVPYFSYKANRTSQSDLVLNGLNISSEKIMQSNYKFKFTKLSSALKAIYRD